MNKEQFIAKQQNILTKKEATLKTLEKRATSINATIKNKKEKIETIKAVFDQIPNLLIINDCFCLENLTINDNLKGIISSHGFLQVKLYKNYTVKVGDKKKVIKVYLSNSKDIIQFDITGRVKRL